MMQVTTNIEEAMPDPGAAYANMAIQPVEYIAKNKLNFLEGNVIKYVSRWRRKGGVNDINKAIYCLRLLIKYENLT